LVRDRAIGKNGAARTNRTGRIGVVRISETDRTPGMIPTTTIGIITGMGAITIMVGQAIIPAWP
jgi:hypothetical protein